MHYHCRLVGLLLITKILPHGSEQAVRDVINAVGFTFLRRLLLPLTRQSSAAGSAEGLQKQQLSCTLAIAITSAACRLQDFAASDEVIELVPLFSKVLTAGGVGRCMLADAAAAGVQAPDAAAWVDAAADAAAVVDAQDCLRAVMISSSYGAQVVQESGGYTAAAAGLAACLAAGADSQLAMTMSAVQLLGLLLSTAPEGRQQLITGRHCKAGSPYHCSLLLRVAGGVCLHGQMSAPNARPCNGAQCLLSSDLPCPMLAHPSD